MRKKKKNTAFDVVLAIVMFLLIFIFVYPFWYVLMVSFNDNTVQSYSKIVFWPKAFTLDTYKVVFANKSILKGYVITIARTLLGTFLGVMCTSMFAYALHVKYLVFRKWFMRIIVFTMLFGGGQIPYYLTLHYLGLIDNFWVYIIPYLLGSWNIMMMRTYFTSSIPYSLEEAARIDGAHELSTFFRIILPSSKPIIATIALFIAVGHWNDWWAGEILVNNRDIWPVQNVLRNLITNNETLRSIQVAQVQNPGAIKAATPETVRMAAVIVVTLPILVVYPFCQKYFVKGVMIGSVKE